MSPEPPQTPPGFINFTKVYNHVTKKYGYRVRLDGIESVSIPVHVPNIAGPDIVFVYALHADCVLPAKDFEVLLHGAVGYIFEISLPADACPNPYRAGVARCLVETPENMEAITSGGTFTTPAGRFTSVKADASVTEIVEAVAVLEKMFNPSRE